MRSIVSIALIWASGESRPLFRANPRFFIASFFVSALCLLSTRTLVSKASIVLIFIIGSVNAETKSCMHLATGLMDCFEDEKLRSSSSSYPLYLYKELLIKDNLHKIVVVISKYDCNCYQLQYNTYLRKNKEKI